MTKTLATLNGILGLWLVLSAFLSFSASVNLWNYLTVGVLITIFGFWGAGAKNA
jgi:predicted CDP-diglyceride synthetase/phosphatidate cytidylyltransferase